MGTRAFLVGITCYNTDDFLFDDASALPYEFIDFLFQEEVNHNTQNLENMYHPHFVIVSCLIIVIVVLLLVVAMTVVVVNVMVITTVPMVTTIGITRQKCQMVSINQWCYETT